MNELQVYMPFIFGTVSPRQNKTQIWVLKKGGGVRKIINICLTDMQDPQ